jgi:peroxiredoxin
MYEPHFRGRYEELQIIVVSPDGTAKPYARRDGTPAGPSRMVFLHDAKSSLEDQEIYVPILSSGRGYSLLLHRITEVSEGDDGLLYCKGEGISPTGRPCNWDLTVDTAAAYMVRRAKCVRQDNGIVSAEIENEGLKRFERGPLPEFARFAKSPDAHKRDPEAVFEVTFVELESQADGDVIANARKLLRREYPSGTQVLDHRGLDGTSKIYVVGETVPSDPIVGKRAPELDVAQWVNCEPTSTESLQGKVMVLAFWDTGDEACADLVQSFNDMLTEHSERRLEIISIHSTDADLGALKKFISDNSIAFRVAVDKPAQNYRGATFERYMVKEVPAVFVIDAKGSVRYQDIALAAVEEAVKRLLDEQ